jgi:hypothetical protein
MITPTEHPAIALFLACSSHFAAIFVDVPLIKYLLDFPVPLFPAVFLMYSYI